mmetsp:Transcript_60163/g.137997  ORF Transcript_60163/g.137997 Transcript_60163/m.137997 type:complete len:272 (-) Transcript_60163:21-836(-)
MVRLVQCDLLHHVKESRRWPHPPVVERNRRHLLIRPRRVQLRSRRAHQLDDVRVGVDRHLLDVADGAVRGARGEDVQGDEEARPPELQAVHDGTLRGRHLKGIDEREEVHPLILRLLEERMDPSVIARHGAQRREVAVLGRDHAGHAGDGLEEEEARDDALWGRVRRVVAGELVERPVGAVNGARDHFLREQLRLVPRLRLEPEVDLGGRPHVVDGRIHPLLLHAQRVRVRRVAEVDRRDGGERARSRAHRSGERPNRRHRVQETRRPHHH